MAKKSVRDQLSRSQEETGDELRLKRAKEALAAEKRESKRIQKALEKELKEAESRSLFLSNMADAPDPKPFKLRKRRVKSGLPLASYIMLASDWHMGERVRPANVQNKNEYNPEIAQERAERFFKSNLTMLQSARASWNIEQVVFWLGGDLMTGYIHEEYLEENFLSPVEEALLVFKTIVSGINTMLDQYDVEHILIPTSYGNHGRTGLKTKIASSAKNSYEWMLYQFLAMHFASEPRVTFQVTTGYNNLVDLYGFRINFHHGDAIRYAGGVGGLAVPANRRFGRASQGLPIEWEGTIMAAPHLNVFGHFHQRLFPGSFIVNGSLIGWNDFAERIGCPFEPAAQTSFVVDNRYKVVSHYNPIMVEG